MAGPPRDPIDCWLALARAPGLGARAARRLLERFGDPCEAFHAPASALAELGLGEAARAALAGPQWTQVASDRRWLASPGHGLLTLADAEYPALLRVIADPPPVLFVRGDAGSLAAPGIAIVGSRNPTPSGAETAFGFARALARAGLTVVSGLALGIDAASHRGALAAGGATVAVAGCGPDLVYPARHRALAAEVAASGAVISEFPPGTPPRAGHFPRRNRLLSGLSLGVLVVEAGRASGSLITARFALEQGREVFAVPGSIHNPLARGCHALIREGAKLVETAQDVLEEIAPQLASSLAGENDAPATSAPATSAPATSAPTISDREQAPPALDEDYRELLAAMGFEAASVDVLVERTGLTAGEVSSMLLQLELNGYVTSVSGGRYTRSGPNP